MYDMAMSTDPSRCSSSLPDTHNSIAEAEIASLHYTCAPCYGVGTHDSASMRKAAQRYNKNGISYSILFCALVALLQLIQPGRYIFNGFCVAGFVPPCLQGLP